MSVINIFRNKEIPVISACTDVGVGFSQIFVKLYEVNGAPGMALFSLANVLGTFSALTINLEFSPTNSSGQYFEVVATWTPLISGQGVFQAITSEAGFYRLNVTAFTASAGAQFDVLATVALPNGSTNGGGNGGDVNIFDSNGNVLNASSGALNVDLVSVGGDAIQTGVVPTAPGAPQASAWSSAAINFSSSGSNTVIAGSSGKTIRVYKLQFTVNGTTAVYFLDSASNTFSGSYVLTGNGSAFSDYANGNPLFVTASGAGFQINSSVAVSVQGQVWYGQS